MRRVLVALAMCVGMLLAPSAANAAKDVTIANGGTAQLSDVDQFSDHPGESLTISPQTIAATSQAVTIAASNDIVVQDDVAATAGLQTLGLTAGRSLTIASGVDINAGVVGLVANAATVPLAGSPQAMDRQPGPGVLTQAVGSTASGVLVEFLMDNGIGVGDTAGPMQLSSATAQTLLVLCPDPTECHGLGAAGPAPQVNLLAPQPALIFDVGGDIATSANPLSVASPAAEDVLMVNATGAVHIRHAGASLRLGGSPPGGLPRPLNGVQAFGDVDLTSTGHVLLDDPRGVGDVSEGDATIRSGGDVSIEADGYFDSTGNHGIPAINAAGDVDVAADAGVFLGYDAEPSDVLGGDAVTLTSSTDAVDTGTSLVESNRNGTAGFANELRVDGMKVFQSPGGRMHAVGAPDVIISATSLMAIAANATDERYAVQSDAGGIHTSTHAFVLNGVVGGHGFKASDVRIEAQGTSAIQLGATPPTDQSGFDTGTDVAVSQEELDRIEAAALTIGSATATNTVEVVEHDVTRTTPGTQLLLASSGIIRGPRAISATRLGIVRTASAASTYVVGSTELQVNGATPLPFATPDLLVQAGPAGDTIEVTGNPADRHMTLSADDGDDRLFLDSNTSGSPGGSLDTVLGNVHFLGDDGDDSWSATDADAATGHTYSLGTGVLQRDALSILNNVTEHGRLETTGQSDNVKIVGNLIDLEVDSGAQNDQITLGNQSHSLDGIQPVTIDGGAGDDFVKFDDTGSGNPRSFDIRPGQAGVSGGSLHATANVEGREVDASTQDDVAVFDADGGGPGEVLGDIGRFSFVGGAGNDSAVFHDRDGAAGATWDVGTIENDGPYVSRTPGALVTTPGVEQRQVLGSNGGSAFTASATPAAVNTELDGGAAADTFAFTHLDDFLGTLLADGGGGGDHATYDDSAATAAGTWTLANASITRAGVPQMPTLSEIAHISAIGSPQADTFNVTGVRTPITTDAHGGAGNDVFKIGNAGDLSDMKGPFSIAGDVGNDLVTFDDSAGSAHTYTVTPTALKLPAPAPDLGFATVEGLTLKTTPQADQITAVPSLVPLTLDAGAGSDGLTVDDTAASTPHQWGITDTGVTRDGAAPMTHANVESLTANGGGGADTFAMKGPTALDVTVDGNDPGAAPGDTLVYDAEGRSATRTAGPSGAVSSPPRKDVTFRDLEDVALTNVPAPVVTVPPVQAATPPPPTSRAAPVITQLHVTRCVRATALVGAKPGVGRLAVTFNLSAPARVQYILKRVPRSPQRSRCPVDKRLLGKTPVSFTDIATASLQANSAGKQKTAIGKAARLPKVSNLRRGRHVAGIAVAKGQRLAPGTYMLLVRATDDLGQRSNDALIKFFVLKGTAAKRRPRT